MEYSDLFRFALLGVLLCGSAFFAGSEIAFFSLGAAKVAGLRRGGGAGPRVGWLLDNPHRLLVVIFLGNELINVAFSAITTVIALDLFGDLGVALFLGSGAMMLLVFGEIAPKAFAHAHNERWALAAAGPLGLFMRIVHPAQVVVTRISEMIVDLLGLPEAKDHAALSEEEFLTMMEEGAGEGVIEESEKEMVQNVFELGDATVSEIMTPRTDILALEINVPVAEALEMMNQTSYVRAPVYEKDIDNIVGTLYKKDFLKLGYPPPEGVTIRSMIREPLIVPMTMLVKELLREFQRRKVHMAVVFDEYGGARGVVTMDDVLDILVGGGVSGREGEDIARMGSGTFKIPALLPLAKFREHFGGGPQSEEIMTIGGYVFHLFGKPPKWGENVDSHGFRFTVEKVKGHRIMELRVKRLEETPKPPERQE
jgi:CBS domain containing-hemolysin-like protein